MKRAIVLADERSPKQVNGAGHAKALAKVDGLPLIVRNLRTLKAAGVEEAVVVTGYKADLISQALNSYHVGIKIVQVHNPNWERGSAHSLIEGASKVDAPCLVVPSDHLYPPSLVKRMIRFPAPVDSIVLAVDRRMEELFDENECIKVRLKGDLAEDVGMHITSPDGVAPGMIRISDGFIETLRRLVPDADLSLLDCLRAMARQGRVRMLDVLNARWISISSPQALRYAELLLKLHGDTLETLDTGGQAVLLNPGPVATTPRVKAAMGTRDMCHREPIFSSLLDSVQRKLRTVFGATEKHDVLLVTSSGTGGVESAISTFVPRKSSFLVLSNGAFGERFAEIARTYNIEVLDTALPWGEEIRIEDVERYLDANPSIGAVGMVHHETSVGILNPVAEVGKLARARGVTFIVDAVSSMGGEDIDVERDRIDVCVTSANKCLHSLSGLACVCVHENVWKTVEKDEPRSYYLNLFRYRKMMVERRQTPFTPAVNTMMSLNAALDELLEVGVSSRHDHYKRLNSRLRSGLRSLGFSIMVDEKRSSRCITVVEVPADLSYQEIYLGLKERGFIVYESKGPMADRYFQVANMGALEETHIDGFLAAVKDLLVQARSSKRFKAASVSTV